MHTMEINYAIAVRLTAQCWLSLYHATISTMSKKQEFELSENLLCSVVAVLPLQA